MGRDMVATATRKSCSHCRRGAHPLCTRRAMFNAAGKGQPRKWEFTVCACNASGHASSR